MEDSNLTAITHTNTPARQNSSLFTGKLVYMPRARCKVPRVLDNTLQIIFNDITTNILTTNSKTSTGDNPSFASTYQS